MAGTYTFVISFTTNQTAALSGFVAQQGWASGSAITQQSAAVSYIALYMTDNYRQYLTSSAIATAISDQSGIAGGAGIT